MERFNSSVFRCNKIYMIKCIKPKAIKFLEENRKKNLCDLGVGKCFLDTQA